MMKYRYEYRINKKGAECFRTDDIEKAKEKLKALSEKRPGVYTMQSRSLRLNRYGVADMDGRGDPAWSIWR